MTKQGRQTDRIRQVLHLLMQLPRLALLASLVYGLVVLDWELAGISVAVLITTYGLFAARKWFNWRVPPDLELWYVVFIYASIFLGTYLDFYSEYVWWDALLHFGSLLGLTFGLYLLAFWWQSMEKIQLPPSVVCLLVFSAATTVGALWEIYEFWADIYLGPLMDFQMQASNRDTMLDLIFNSLGAGLGAVLSYQHLKYNRLRWMRRLSSYVAKEPSH